MFENMKYRILGDQHSRVNWHQLVEPFDENTIYVFVGDYTDPYYGYEEGVSYLQMLEEINRTLEFKRQHPDNVVLLIGNHDLQYWLGKGDTNRYDWQHAPEIEKLFWDNKDLFHGIAYHVGEKYLITHAGVTYEWYTRHCDSTFEAGNSSLEEICDNINKLWWGGKEGVEQFTFSKCVSKFSDCYGDSATHSPVWIRPMSLWEHNLFGFTSGVIQVVGHTPFPTYKNWDSDGKIGTYNTKRTPATDEEIDKGTDYYLLDGLDKCSLVENEDENIEIIFVDCLRIESACIEIDEESMEWKKITK